MLGGLLLHVVFNLLDERRKGARVMRTEGVQRLLTRLRGRDPPEDESVVRFSPTDRLEHLASMLTFTLLVVTGLPQTRPDLAVANGVISFFGGIATTRFVHRAIGFLFVALMVTHVARAVMRAIRGRRLPVMVPSRSDFADVLQTVRHYLTAAPRPRVGKFDYAEKFEYWGLFLGAIVMSVSGLVLVFPVLVTLVLPGEAVAALRTMHGLEATFAVMVVVLWHSYGVILRPAIFPLDTSIFTGRMSVARLAHEHPLEFERLFPERASKGDEADAARERAPAAEDGSVVGA
jgi:cytochrome b subunit of formate dehydrogenase